MGEVEIDPAVRSAQGEQTVVVRFVEPDLPASADRQETIELLQEHANATQTEVLSMAANDDRVTVEKRFWITNAVLLRINATAVSTDSLASLEYATAVHDNFEVGLPEPAPEAGSDDAGAGDHGDVTYGLDQVNAPEVWEEYDTQGEGVKVAVLDTGVDDSHPDISVQDQNWAEFDYDDGSYEDTEPNDGNSHGTHVSGTVLGGDASGTHIGVAPEATLMHAKVLEDDGFGSFVQIVSGMQWAVNNDADVISMSLGAKGQYPGWISPVKNARSAGVVVVASSGNSGLGTSGSPGNVYEAFAVGASDPDENIAPFSSGEEIDTEFDWGGGAPDDWPETYVVPDVAAPGWNVESAVPGGGYGSKYGTSMAAPHVSGAIALMLSAAEGTAAGDLSPAEIESTLKATAVDNGEQATRQGDGIIDAEAATDALIGGPKVSVTAPGNDDIVENATTTVTYELGDTFVGDAAGVEYRVDGGDYQAAEFETVSGTTTFDVAVGNLSEGEHTVEFRIVDGEGNLVDGYESTEDAVTFTVDTAAPSVAVANAEDGVIDYENGTRIVLAVDDATAVNVTYAENATGTSNASLAPPYEIDAYNESWTEGPVEISVNATDAAGNVRTESFIVRLASPPAVDAVSPSATVVNETTPTLTVNYSDDGLGERETGVDPASVSLSVDGESVDLGGADADGFEQTLTNLSVDDPDGTEHTVTVTVADNASHETTVVRSFVVDTLAPRTDVAAEAADAGDGFDLVGPNNPAVVTASATDANPGATVVRVRDSDGDVRFERNVSNATGSDGSAVVEWNATGAGGDEVETGSYEVVVDGVDAAGNRESSNVTVTVDTADPNVSVVDLAGGTLDDGRRYTNDTVTVTVAADDAPTNGTVEGVDVRLAAAGYNYGIEADATPVDGTDDRYNVTLDLEALGEEGEFLVQPTAVDRARNENTTTSATTVVYDEGGPDLSTVVTVDADNDTGTVTVRSSEALEAAPTVTVDLPGNDATTVTTSRIGENRYNGTFTASASGSYDTTVTGVDLAGNTGNDTAASTVQSVTTNNRTATVLNADTGTFVTFNTSADVNDTTVSVSENDAAPEPLAATLSGVGFLTSELGTALSSNLTNATIAVPVGDLPAGVDAEDVRLSHYNETSDEWESLATNVVSVDRQIDNETVSGEYWTAQTETFSTFGAVAEDTTAPATTDESPTGNLPYGQTSATVRFEYEDDLTGIDAGNVTLTFDGQDVTDAAAATITTDAAEFDAAGLDPGTTYAATVTVADEAGNEETYTTDFTVVEDTTPPTIDSIDPSDGTTFDASTNNVTVSVEYSDARSGVDPGAVTLTFDGEDVTDAATVDGSGATYTATNLSANATYDVTVAVDDGAGTGPTTETVQFTVEAEEEDDDDDDDDDDDGDGGGGGQGGDPEAAELRVVALDGQRTVTVRQLPRGELGEATFETAISGAGVSVAGIEVTSRFGIADRFRIEVGAPAERPPGRVAAVPESTATAVGYVRAEAFNVDLDRLDPLTVRFSVDEGALPEGASPADVTAYAYVDGEWQSVETNAAGGTVTATLPTVTTFAVAVENDETPTPTATPTATETATPTPAASGDESESTTDATATTSSDGPGFTVVGALLAVLLSALALRRRA